MLKFPAAAVVGLASAAIHLAAKLLPHERIVFRTEDEKGHTTGVFSKYGKAARTGDNVVEEIIDPKLFDAYEVRLTPMGDLISRRRIVSKQPIQDDAQATGLDGCGPVEIVGTSTTSQLVADALAREGLIAFNTELSTMCGMSYAFGRLHNGREGFGLIRNPVSVVRIFKNSMYFASPLSFEEARKGYKK